MDTVLTIVALDQPEDDIVGFLEELKPGFEFMGARTVTEYRPAITNGRDDKVFRRLVRCTIISALQSVKTIVEKQLESCTVKRKA